MATSKAKPTQHVSSAAAATPTQHVSSAAAASETEFSIRSELEHVGPERSRLHSKKSKMQHPWRVQQQQMSHLPEDDDFEVTPGGASSSSAGVVFGGGPLVPPLPRFGTAAKATQAFLAREPQSLAAAAPVVGNSADLWASFRARQREASVRRPRSPDHPPPNRPARPAPVPPTLLQHLSLHQQMSRRLQLPSVCRGSMTLMMGCVMSLKDMTLSCVLA